MLLLMISLATAQTGETTRDITVTTIPPNDYSPAETTVDTTLQLIQPNYEEAVEALPLNETVVIMTEINVTNGTIDEYNQTEETTTTMEPPTTTMQAVPETTITVPNPICGNLYQEVGEECDTTTSPCGAGYWKCVDCKCIATEPPNPPPQLQNIDTSDTMRLVDVLNAPEVTSETDLLDYAIPAAILFIVLVALIYHFGKENGN